MLVAAYFLLSAYLNIRFHYTVADFRVVAYVCTTQAPVL